MWQWHDTLVNMFVLGAPWLEKILRPILVYVFLIVGLRIAGKRELAQLNPFDLIVLLTLSNTVQNAIIGNDNSVTGGVIGAATLLAVNYLVVRFLFRHRRIDRLVEGKRDWLIREGQVLKDHLNRELMTRAELIAAAHKQGIACLEDVESAILEPTGTITFIQRSPTPDFARHSGLLTRFDTVMKELTTLRSNMTRSGGGDSTQTT
jgi:uncharacterized membrane protein YcaP (DUF421 family)